MRCLTSILGISHRFTFTLMIAGLAVLLVIALGGTMEAATKTWDNGSADFAWNTSSTNWTPSNWANGDEAVFGATGVGTITVDAGGVIATNLTFNTAGYTIGGGTITLDTGGNQIVGNENAIINSNLIKTGAGYFHASALSGKTVTINGNITNTAAANIFYVNGAGHVILNGSIGDGYTSFQMNSGTSTTTFAAPNSFTGTLHLLAAGGAKTLNFSDVNQLGTGTGGNYIAIQGGSILRYTGTGSQQTAGRDLYWNSGAATIDITQASANLIFDITGGTRNQIFTKAGAGQLTLKKSTAISESSANAWTLNGGTLQFEQNHAGASNTFTGIVSGAGNVILSGPGSLTFSGANTYTGATSAYGGSLTLNYATQNNSKLSNTAALTLGGTALTLSGGSHIEVVGSTTLNTGASAVTRPAGTSVLAMGAITRNPGATIGFSADNIATTTNAVDATGILGTWATVGTQYATKSGSNIVAYTGTTALGVNNYTSATTNYEYPGIVGTDALTANRTANTARYHTGTGQTIDLATFDLTLNGLINASSGTLVVQRTGVTGSVQAGSTGELVLNTASNNITISAPIGGGGTVIKTGANTLSLTGANTHSGGTTLNAGTLSLGSTTALGSGTLTINGGTLGSSVPSLVNANNNAQVWNGVVSFTGTNNLDLGTGAVSLGTTPGTSRIVSVNAGTLTVGGSISDGTTATGIENNGLGRLVLAGNSANIYTGATRVNTGSLVLSKTAGIAAIPGDLMIYGDASHRGTVWATADNQLGGANTILSGTRAINGGLGTFALNGTTQSIAGINTTTTDGLMIANSATTSGTPSPNNPGTGTLNLVGSGNYTHNAYLWDAWGTGGKTALTLNMGAGGTQTLIGGNITYTGDTTLNSGTLELYNTTVFNSTVAVNSGAELKLTNSAGQNWGGGLKVNLNNGGLLTHDGLTSNSQHLVLGGSVTNSGSTTINQDSITGTTVNKSLFLDGGLHGSGTITINAANAGNAVILRNTSNTFEGNIIVNGIASPVAHVGSGIGIGGANTSLNGVDFTVNGTMELLNQGIGWSAGVTHSSFGALSGTGVVVGNYTSNGNITLTLGNTDNDGSFSGTIANGLGNIVNISKVGSGTQTFTGINTFTGRTVISGGTLSVSDVGGIGQGTGGNYFQVYSGGTFQYTGTGAQSSTNRDVYWNSGNATIDITSATGDLKFNMTGGNLSSGGGTFTKTGAGTLTLATAGSNMTTKNVALNQGTLALQANGANQFSFLQAVTGASGTQIKVLAGTGIVSNSSFTADWTANLADMDIAAGGKFGLYGDPIWVDALTGGGDLFHGYNSGAGAGTRTVTLGVDNGSGTFTGVIHGNGTSGTLGTLENGVLAVTKIGTGTQTLSGTNTYTGTTNVNGGKLLINGNHTGGGTITVGPSGTLGGSGTVNSLVTGSGFGSPGSSPGIFTASQTDPSGGMDFGFEFTATGDPTWNTAGASVNDVWRSTHASDPFNGGTFDSNNVIDIYLGVTSVAVHDLFRGGFYTDRNSDFLSTVAGANFQFWVLGDGSGSDTTFNSQGYYSFANFAPGSWVDVSTSQVVSANFSGGTISNGWVMQFTVVPEPETITLGLLGLLGLGFFVWRRHRSA